MKKIKGLSEVFKGFDGKELDKEITVKKALLNILGTTVAENGEQAVKIVKLGQELYDAKDEFHFEEADEALLKKAVDGGVRQYVPIVIAKLTEVLNQAVAYSPNKNELETKSDPQCR